MTAISKSKHYKFSDDVQVFLSNLMEHDLNKTELQSELELLEQLYKEYQDNIKLLHGLISSYETMQHKIKLNLRKRQIHFFKQKYL